jgi:hypothetical protein
MMIMADPSKQSYAVGTLPQAERRDFSGVGYAEAMRRAREIVPILRERAQKAEEARMLIAERAAPARGLFRFHQPKAFGGMELDFVAVVDRRGLARLPVHGLERGTWPPPLDPRPHDRRPRGVGREPGRIDRLVHRAPPAAGGRSGRVHRQRPLALLSA